MVSYKHHIQEIRRLHLQSSFHSGFEVNRAVGLNAVQPTNSAV
jgi:hypothetical protein